MSVHHWLRLLAFPMRTSAFANGQTWDLPVPAQGASTHARFFDPAGSPSLAISCLTMLPSAFETASAPGTVDFVAQWLAYALPYRRFVDVLANGNARLGADVVRYAFIVSDFHRLLLAGLPAHFESHIAGIAFAFDPVITPVIVPTVMDGAAWVDTQRSDNLAAAKAAIDPVR